MDLQRMLDKCRRFQWRVDDLDWSRTPPAMPRDKELAVVQYFTDMAGIERLAGALFAEQRKKVRDPTLKKIFTTFIVDEERHARVAHRLADFYNVHRYREYRENEHLARFRPCFIHAIHYFSAEIANAYITTGELLLDIALLRSLDHYVDDDTSHAAMELVNRDESRHIAIDFHMIEYYSSEQYQRDLATEPPLGPRERARAWWAFAGMMYHAKPFIHDVFIKPMDLTDPSGERMLEAFKRAQLVGRKPEVLRRPFPRFLSTLQDIFNHPLLGKPLGGVVTRIAGLDGRVMKQLYDEAELRAAIGMSFAELAEEAVQVKYSTSAA